MRLPIYNSCIPDIVLRPADRGAVFFVRAFRLAVFLLILLTSLSALATDWSGAEQQLARKIVAVTGPGTVALTIENRSSLSRRESDIVQNGLRSALEQAGIHVAKPEQAAASVTISLSENFNSYVWVGQIQQSAAESAVVMVSLPRTGRFSGTHDAMPIALRKSLLFNQSERILDMAVLEENGTPTRIAVLNSENVAFYRWVAGKWQGEQSLGITRTKPWPLDLRGRLVVTRDRLIDAYLPGVVCHIVGAAMNCRDGDDPWPISQPWMFAAPSSLPGAATPSPGSAPTLSAFFAPTRNFFTGVINPAVGKFSTVTKFYSAAFIPRERYSLWLFASTDGKVHLVDGMNDQASMLDWGSDVATVRTSCGAGWQILATSTTGSDDAIKAFELPDRDPVAVSPALEMPGQVTALWAESKGDSAIAVVDDRESGNYEAFRVALACNQ